MTIDATRFQKLLGEFKLEQLFNELGWDRPSLKSQTIFGNGEAFTLTNIAHKRGVAVFRCSPDKSGKVPARPVLLKIEKEATKIAHEHLLVFADAAETMLTWLWVSRIPGQPTTTRTHTWHKGQSGESLRQKLSQIVWSLEEEEAITLTDVITGLRNAFDRDRVSKSFYDKFKSQHEAFVNFIEGLSGASAKAWYASLMLNRLMFVYFIQKKGFLDGDENYLTNRMAKVRAAAGKGKFHSFYRQFLRRLFHEGLGQAKGGRNPELTRLIGNVPYLNGGLFSLHELEESNPGIDVPDEAFERLFAFFDAWDWHLDDRPLASGREINPDVLGYIFEKYINQKQMGAYYTKEDITEYISKSAIIPHLIEQARDRCKVAFEGEASVWGLLQSDPDRYIYPAMKSGVIDAAGNIVPETALPDFVQTGMKDAKARMFDRRYNLGEAVFYTAAGERGTLPTETWREYVERRSRCLAVRDKLAKGEIRSPDDLITLNLDIRQFMQDVIDTSASPDLLRAIWQAIVGSVPEQANEKFRHGITILDPTCGSGAFLFAALSVLEPLYEACLERMEGFVEDAKKLGKVGESDFLKVLSEVDKHPSRRYYIFKSIILHNLFGVDIMAEAVEICKLRLFLKLVSQVNVGRELEPLPDIDFNVRVGNTLVGYATEAQFDTANSLASDQAHRDEIKTRTAELAELFNGFREQQTIYGGKITADDKRKLRDKLTSLSLELDRYLAREYGIDPDQTKAFAMWRESHQPFHWFAQFYGVMREGGFDVVIGNPPYVEVKDLKGAYQLAGYKTQECGNLYAMCSERGLQIAHASSGKFGFIIPIASICTDGYSTLKSEFISAGKCFFSSYNDRPGRLFDGLEHIRLAIVLVHRSRVKQAFTTKYNKWNTAAREYLFPTLRLQENEVSLNWSGAVPKIGTSIEVDILQAVTENSIPIGAEVKLRHAHKIYYTRKLSGFVQVLNFIPSITDDAGNERPPSELKEITFMDKNASLATLALLNSSLFYWFLTLYSDVRNLNKREVFGFPVKRLPEGTSIELANLASQLMTDFKRTSQILTMRYKKNGTLHIQCVYPKLSKKIIDRIDIEYGRAIGLNDEQLDFIINYDIKYRMGGADGEE
ncbi:TPA: Eco57I restriction-modification methylase domain-containing protein [Burkholderia multivorans]|nr:Eco57I restriction-modification methylase domain-containing protein [Burkholderia multivorans]